MQFEDMSLKKGTKKRRPYIRQEMKRILVVKKCTKLVQTDCLMGYEENQHALPIETKYINCFMVMFQREMKSIQRE